MARSRSAEPDAAQEAQADANTNEDVVETPNPAPEGEQAAAPVAEPEAKKEKPEKRKFPLPEGFVPPVAFRHELVKQGLAGENLSSAQIYILSRKASSNGMPIKHFDRAGNQYDEKQDDPITGETLTRPGLKMAEGLEWWKNRPKRQPGQKKEKKEGDAPATADADTASSELTDPTPEELAALEADPGFTEAE